MENLVVETKAFSPYKLKVPRGTTFEKGPRTLTLEKPAVGDIFGAIDWEDGLFFVVIDKGWNGEADKWGTITRSLINGVRSASDPLEITLGPGAVNTRHDSEEVYGMSLTKPDLFTQIIFPPPPIPIIRFDETNSTKKPSDLVQLDRTDVIEQNEIDNLYFTELDDPEKKWYVLLKASLSDKTLLRNEKGQHTITLQDNKKRVIIDKGEHNSVELDETPISIFTQGVTEKKFSESHPYKGILDGTITDTDTIRTLVEEMNRSKFPIKIKVPRDDLSKPAENAIFDDINEGDKIILYLEQDETGKWHPHYFTEASWTGIKLKNPTTRKVIDPEFVIRGKAELQKAEGGKRRKRTHKKRKSKKRKTHRKRR